MMFAYLARIIKEDDTYIVSFRDFEGGEPVTQAFSYKEALSVAQDWLLCEAAIALDRREKLPDASKKEEGEVLIEMPISAQMKLLLLYEMLSQSITGTELARRMNIKRQSIQRIIKADHTTKIDTIDKAFHALGKKIRVEIVSV